MPTTSNKPTRAAIYARVSTTEQDTGMQVAELPANTPRRRVT